MPVSPILLIDDDRDFTAVMSQALRKRGHQVHCVHDAEAALACRAQAAPASVIVDLRLGADNGLSLLSALRDAWPDAVLVMLTGYGSIATAVEAMKRGADDYVVKPVHADELLAVLDRQHAALAADEAEAQAPSEPLRLSQLEWEHIQRVLNEHDGNISAAARALGIHRRTLQRRLAKAPRPR